MKFQSPNAKDPRQPSTIADRTRTKRKSPYDRHIRQMDSERYSLHSCSPSSEKSTSSYHSQLEESLLKRKTVRQYTLEKRQKDSLKERGSSKVKRRVQPIRRFKVNGWSDNYYSSLLDWSYSNFICAANGQTLYFFNMAMDEERESAECRQYVVRSGSENINAIHFSPTVTKIAMGYSEGTLKLYDYLKEKVTESFSAHTQRITAIEWYDKNIYTGSKDKHLYACDSRSVFQLRKFPKDHTQEICGVKAYASYIATGGNDNCVFIYDIRKSEHYLSKYYHDAAVKALDWIVPNVLVSGGGTTDRKIKFWKDGEGIVSQIDTGSQVCGLVASVNSPEVLSCQGFSLNQIIIWNREGKRELTVHGHKKRVLYCALSPGGRFVATGAGDQIVQIWKFFDSSSYRDWAEEDIR